MVFWSVFCAFVGLGFATESAGLFAHETNLILAVVALVLSALLMRPRDGAAHLVDPGGRRQGLAACALGLLLLPGSLTLRLFAAALWFWGLDALAAARGRRGGTARALATACLFAGMLHYAAGNSVLGWYGLQHLSSAISKLGAAASGHAMTLGPSYNGWLLVLLAVFAGLAALGRGPARRPAVLAACLVVIAAIFVAYLCLYTIVPAVQPQSPATQPAAGAPLLAHATYRVAAWFWRGVRFIYPNHLPLLLTAALAFVVGASLRCAERPIEFRRASALRPSVVVAVLAFLAAWAWTNVPARARPGPLKVALYKEGFLNWMTPNHQMYGARSAGMFGNMPILCRQLGWQPEFVDEITRDTLADKHILVIMNMNKPLPYDSLRAIYDFVERGGSLLELGDHTFQKTDGRLVLNDPIERTHIRYAFDSAYYFLGGWLHSYQYWPHQINDALGDADNDCGCVVGASLNIEYPAAPIVIGRYGWSDPGEDDRADRGFMGNSLFDRGEPLGDLVLVAAENVGRGRVVIVGDTSGFVNAIQTQTWPFTQRVFYWLGSQGDAAIPAWRDVLGWLLMILLAGVTFVAPGPHRMTIAVAAVSLYLAGWASHRVVATLAAPPPMTERVAVVDLSHVGLHSIEGWRDNGIAGVYLNLMREGYFAIGMRHFDPAQVLGADMFITIAPTTPYTRAELDVLRRFMESGGTVLLSVGYEQRAAAQSLLDLGGLTLAHRPLGRAATYVPNATVMPQFWNAWPVLGGETLVPLRGDPVIVQKPIGRGKLVVVGDTYFFMNRNLEGEEGGVVPNIQFFGWLMQRIAPGATP